MIEQAMIIILGVALTALNTMTLFILNGLRQDVKDLIQKVDDHITDHEIHCKPELMQVIIKKLVPNG